MSMRTSKGYNLIVFKDKKSSTCNNNWIITPSYSFDPDQIRQWVVISYLYHFLSKYTLLLVSYQRKFIIIILFSCFNQKISFWCFDYSSKLYIIYVTGLICIKTKIMSSQGKSCDFWSNQNPKMEFFS